MSELSADQASEHQSSIKQAQEAARELQDIREKLEQKKRDDEERLKREAEGEEGGGMGCNRADLYTKGLSSKRKKKEKKKMR